MAVADALERRQTALERAGELELHAGELLLRVSETYGPEDYEQWLREELGLTPGDVRGYLTQAKEARQEMRAERLRYLPLRDAMDREGEAS
jgi:hypothetical protein